MSSTALTQRRTTRRSRNTNYGQSVIAESRPSRPTEVTARRHSNQAGQTFTTFRDLQGAGVSGGNFFNATAVNIHNVPTRQPLDNPHNVAVGTNANNHQYRSNIGTPSHTADHDIYHNCLLRKGRGTPLYVPGPNTRLPTEYRTNGVSIGDVGILYRAGGFAFLFNIFLAANDRINVGRVPNGFIPLDWSKVEKTITGYSVFGRGSCLASSSLRRTSSDFAFQTTGSEGAVLVMPDGALSEDLHGYRLVEKYIADNAKSWYEYVESDDCGMRTENGDIRIVIGTDKVSSWGMATFENVNVEEPLQFEFKDDGRSSQAPTYKWDGIVAGRTGPPEEEIRQLTQGPNASPLRNQCVFVRTLNVSVAGKVRDELTVFEVRASCFRDSISDSSRQQGPSRQRNLNFQDSQIGLPVSHPSNFLNKCLLQKCPNAEVIITKDSDWISVITEDDATTPSFEDLCARVLASYIICEKKGVVTLEKRKNINTGCIPDSSAITTPAPQQTISEVGNEKESHVIGRLFLETPVDRSLTESVGTLKNTLMENHGGNTRGSPTITSKYRDFILANGQPISSGISQQSSPLPLLGNDAYDLQLPFMCPLMPPPPDMLFEPFGSGDNLVTEYMSEAHSLLFPPASTANVGLSIPIGVLSHPQSDAPLLPLSLTTPHDGQSDCYSQPALPLLAEGSGFQHSDPKATLLKFYDRNFKNSQPLLPACEKLFRESVTTLRVVQANRKRRKESKDEGRWICPLKCSNFTRKQNLKYHIQSHLGIRGNGCLCGKTFNAPSSLRRHQKKCRKCYITEMVRRKTLLHQNEPPPLDDNDRIVNCRASEEDISVIDELAATT